MTIRLTERALRQIVREELLREARRRPEDLPSGMMVAITINDRRGALITESDGLPPVVPDVVELSECMMSGGYDGYREQSFEDKLRHAVAMVRQAVMDEAYKGIGDDGKVAKNGDRTTALERKMLDYYTGPGGKIINRALRSGTEDALDEKKRLCISTLDDLLSRTTLPAQVVYRGVMDPGFVSRVSALKAGAVITDPAFMSTETDRAYSKGPGVRMEIQIPGGTPGFDAGGAEFEVILPRHTRLKVLSITREEDSWDLLCRVL